MANSCLPIILLNALSLAGHALYTNIIVKCVLSTPHQSNIGDPFHTFWVHFTAPHPPLALYPLARASMNPSGSTDSFGPPRNDLRTLWTVPELYHSRFLMPYILSWCYTIAFCLLKPSPLMLI